MKKITACILGSGDRGRVYGNYALAYPEELEITAVVEPLPQRMAAAKKLFSLPDDRCFSDFDSFAAQGKIADCVINCTMDSLHVVTSLPLLDAGYDMLLEKPVCNNEKELALLEECVKRNDSKLMICHVLRYAPFYRRVKQLILDGEIGEVVNIRTDEHVAYNHASAAFIRGKWNNEKRCGSTMLLQKCCHDLDLICWLNPFRPTRTASFGGRNFLIPEKAPRDAAERCLNGCPHVEDCPYSAKKISVEKDIFPQYTCEGMSKYFRDVTTEEKIQSLKTDNPHGVCAYKTDADIVDHQTLILQFENGSTASHTMICGAPRGDRTIHIVGTRGEIEGRWSTNIVNLYRADGSHESYDVEKEIDRADHHLGGDTELMRDFVRFLNGLPVGISCTTISESLNGHKCVYMADRSRVEQKEEPIT